MPRQTRPQPAPDRPWIRDIPNWITALTGVVGLLVTAGLGVAALNRPSPAPSGDPYGSPVANAASAAVTVAPTVSIQPPADPTAAAPATGGAPPAGAGGAAASVEPAVVAIEGFGWDAGVLRIDGTVAKFRGPLWLAIQPANATGDQGWQATPMQFALGDEWTTPRPFAAVFADATHAPRYHIKVFLEHEGFGAGGGPGDDYESFLETEGGAARPSGILDTTVEVPAGT